MGIKFFWRNGWGRGSIRWVWYILLCRKGRKYLKNNDDMLKDIEIMVCLIGKGNFRKRSLDSKN